MPKNDDIDRLEHRQDEFDEWKKEQIKWRQELEKEAAYKRGMLKVIIAVCVTATSAVLGAANYIGGIVYHKWDALRAAIDAYNKAGGAGQ